MPAHQFVQHLFAGMAEWRMTQVMGQRNGLSQVHVKPERTCNRSGDLSGLQGMGQPGAIIVTLMIDEHLGFVFKPAERCRMNDAVAVALKDGALRLMSFGKRP